MDDCNFYDAVNYKKANGVQIPLWTIVTEPLTGRLLLIMPRSDSSMDDCNPSILKRQKQHF